ncbi:MAG: MFS transporter [Bacillota bacterium]
MSRSQQAILANRDFLLVWSGQSVSIFGDTLFGLALMWWVAEVTGSGTAMSAVALATALPRIVLGPIVGVYVDRADRRKLMIVSNLLNTVITAGMASLFWQGIFSLQLILASSLLMGTVSTLHGPAFEASIPALVGEEELIRANSLMQSANSAIGVVTPAVSGIILALAGVGASVMINSVTFAIAALSLVPVDIPSPAAGTGPRRSVFSDAGLGFKYVYSHRLLMPMLVFFAAINLTLAPLGVVLPILILKVLNAGPALLGLFGSFNSAGILGASFLLSVVPNLAKRTGFVLVSAIVGIGLSAALVGFSPNSVLLLAGAAGLGSMSTVANIAAQSIWQREVPEELRGRVFAARHAVSSGLRPVGLAAAGPLSDLLGAGRLMGGAGLLCASAGLIGFLIPGLSRYPASSARASAPSAQTG